MWGGPIYCYCTGCFVDPYTLQYAGHATVLIMTEGLLFLDIVRFPWYMWDFMAKPKVGSFFYGKITWDDGPSDSPSLLLKQPPGLI